MEILNIIKNWFYKPKEKSYEELSILQFLDDLKWSKIEKSPYVCRGLWEKMSQEEKDRILKIDKNLK